MKRCLFVAAFLLLLQGCGAAESVPVIPEPAPDQVIPSSAEGLSLELVHNEFPESPDEIEAVVVNNSGKPFEAGSFYHIEVLEEDGWHIAVYSDAVFHRNEHFRDGGRTLPDQEMIQQTFSVEDLGLILPAGHYRIVKTLLQREPYHEVSIAAPFTVQ